MFPFGSLLSQIPLIILASAYLLYFGASAINRTKSVEDQVEASNKIQVVKNVTTKINISKTFYFHRSRENFFDNHDIFKKPVFCFFEFNVLHYIPERSVNSDFHGSNIFSRPPPFFLQA